MKVKVTIKQTEIAEFDIGDLPVSLIQDLLTKNRGAFDGNWGVSDVTMRGGSDTWIVDSVEVEEA